jgi:hypothetical protein
MPSFFSRCKSSETVSRLPPQKLCHGFRSRPHLKFFVDTPDIGVDGFVTDSELFRDFLIQKTLAQAVEYFLLALGQILRRPG